MQVACPYCSARVAIQRLASHVRLMDGDGHGPHGTVPVDGVDTPWRLRVDADEDAGDEAGKVPAVEAIMGDVRHGRCPACDRGAMALKGGDGLLSRGRRRLACPNCGWESPEWVEIRE